ncbi:nucleotidyltransferase domain-containing protein [Brachyspira sp.]|uniref:nucleotidyltransferase domain-containing protein n=1 Tax=Brachyspira sp. TaxID=1977261 RepID=UPI003D7E83A6
MIAVSLEEFEIIIKILNAHIKKGKVYAFGSRYKNNNRKFSDFDIAIDTGEKLSFEFLNLLKDAFEESDLPYRVDIIDYNNISDKFKKIVDGGNEIIYNSN